MDIDQCDIFLRNLLGPSVEFAGEYGITSRACTEIDRIGYATNFTPDVVAKAIDEKIDLIITHHDAWDFIYGMRGSCVKKLKENSISHLFAHLPLDAADFGTAVSFCKALGAEPVDKIANENGFYSGRVCEYRNPRRLDSVVQTIEKVCNERVQFWKNNENNITRFGIVTGAGSSTSYIQESDKAKCNLYITGEKSLYSVQYAKYIGINLIIGSHTFTEIFGVEALTREIVKEFSHLKIIRIDEEHLEVIA